MIPCNSLQKERRRNILIDPVGWTVLCYKTSHLVFVVEDGVKEGRKGEEKQLWGFIYGEV